jgi:2-polyprenyl-3-methyl-5-hydroxy-6-metoxy-1,4-benzoquinol methylase
MMRWDSTPRARWEQLQNDPDYWARGYFHTTHVDWDGTYKRDYDELRRRDLALLALGDVRGKAILDVACGSGLYLAVLAKEGALVSGQDLSPNAISESRSNMERLGLPARLELGDAARLAFEDASFDGVISGDFVEHIQLDAKRSFFAEVFRVLKPGGVFVIKTPNLTYLRFSVLLKRIAVVARGQSPMGIHIQHTRNNPDCEHRGLSTYRALRAMLLEQLFHTPQFVPQPLSKRPLPVVLQEVLPRLPIVWTLFNRDIILACRKPLFLGHFP